MSKNYIFSSESVGEGHPDKVCDTISDAVLDACLRQDKYSRVACETYAKSNLVVVGGEITTNAKLDYTAIAREAIRGIGYVHDDDVFHADRVLIMNAITSQSPDIAQGVDAKAAEGKKPERASAVMGAMAAPLSADDIRNVAAYFGSQKPGQGQAKNMETVYFGRKIYRGGDATKGLPACAGCHGADGGGGSDEVRC